MARPDDDSPTGGEAAAKHPRVALVLSGGGARSSAHVGVLEVMEQLRIPVDLIVGTAHVIRQVDVHLDQGIHAPGPLDRYRRRLNAIHRKEEECQDPPGQGRYGVAPGEAQGAWQEG